ncbi:transcription termination factor Rho [Spirochaetota bacterium]|nr:transcription termination factor Rho [Spirochaetota bacterium]
MANDVSEKTSPSDKVKIKKIKILKKIDEAPAKAPHPKAPHPIGSQSKPWLRKDDITVNFDKAREIDLEDLNRLSINRLTQIAKQFGVNIEDEEVTKQRVIYYIIEKAINNRQITVSGSGVFEKMSEGYGFLRSPEYNYLPGPEDIYISPSQVRNFALRTGDTVSGQIRCPKSSEKYFALLKVKTVNFETVTHTHNNNNNNNNKFSVKRRAFFDSLTPYYATERLTLENGNLSTRIIDLFAPIGKGQRALIVSPPKAGKTILLQNIANAIIQNHPEVYIIVLLIDERPEEVTDMKRNVKAEVVSSTFDEPAQRHVNVARIVIEKAKRLVEQCHDVVILLDSLTRLARAYNQVEPASGKVLSGGVDSNALHKPKRFFGAARNAEEGGSLSIIATALIDTGSKMDEVIFEEFKGTGNMELVLNRRISERRIFPAVDLKKSGTRREELLFSDEVLQKMFALRNALGPMDEFEIIDLVLKKMKATKTNAGFLQNMNSP